MLDELMVSTYLRSATTQKAPVKFVRFCLRAIRDNTDNYFRGTFVPVIVGSVCRVLTEDYPIM